MTGAASEAKRARVVEQSALWFDGAECTLRHDVPVPVLSELDEVLIQIELAGVCSTDLMIMHGYKSGFVGVLGHEFVGRVVQTSSEEWMGERVVGSINIAGCSAQQAPCNYCQRCSSTSSVLGNHCEKRQVVGILNHQGAFAQYLNLPARNLHKVPPSVTSQQVVFTEPLAAAFRAVEQVEEFAAAAAATLPSIRVAVMGDGKLGSLVVQALRLANLPSSSIVELHVFGRHAAKLANLCLLTNCYAWNESVTRHFARYFDVVIEATGNPAAITSAVSLVRSTGLLVLKSTCSPSVESGGGLGVASINDVVVREISVCGSRCGPFQRALDALEHHRVSVDQLVDCVLPLSPDALKVAREKGRQKVLIQI